MTVYNVIDKMLSYLLWIILDNPHTYNTHKEYTLFDLLFITFTLIIVTIFIVWWLIPLRYVIWKPLKAIRFQKEGYYDGSYIRKHNK